ncbi:MAG: alpha/beta hydrolase [Flavobacterium sp.]
MAKPRLLILSDLFGGKNPEWVNYYVEKLKSKFEIQYYDVLELGDIDTIDSGEVNIHNQFLNGGIDKAVEVLLHQEKEKVTILGFSIGGTIAWKAALKGLKVSHLIAVSSTRLRFETRFQIAKSNCILERRI